MHGARRGVGCSYGSAVGALVLGAVHLEVADLGGLPLGGGARGALGVELPEKRVVPRIGREARGGLVPFEYVRQIVV